MSKQNTRQILGKYSLTGLCNALTGYIVIFSLMFLGVNPMLSNALGYLASLTLAFFLNRQWVFKATHHRISKQAAYFVLSFLISYAINYLVLTALMHDNFNAYLAQFIAGCCYTVSMFLLVRYFVFRPHANQTKYDNTQTRIG